ncbi:RNA 2',3'-cyclic phosphodiesterase [Methyloprofundus sp.]|uniref:RNA 2',3'-cyclic phosphodiesterase n=1 Tax=Methyloprofundus sp. TaxID=2020875 RepID=UPI003D0A8C41
MKRLFFALWPSDETRKQLNSFNQSIAQNGLRKLKADNLHITLLFLGNTCAITEILLRKKADSIRVQPFVLTLDQLEFWRKAKVLCLTTAQYDPQLGLLVDALNQLAEQCAMHIEERAYKPHITLARKAQKLIDIKVLPIQWQADSFCLIESCSTAEGVHYQVLQSWSFAG